MDDQALKRAEQRRAHPERWPMRKFCLGEEPEDNLLSTTTAEERLQMVATLSERAWVLTGKPKPSYTRATMPGHIRRGQLDNAS